MCCKYQNNAYLSVVINTIRKMKPSTINPELTQPVSPNLPDTIWIDLGYIGHKADKIKTIFPEYSDSPNEYGYYLRITNHSHLASNHGVTVETNCFSSEAEFKDRLLSLLLFNL